MNIKVGGSLGWSGHDMKGFRIPSESRAKSRTATMDFKRRDFNLFRDVLGRIVRDMALEVRRLQEIWPSSLKKGSSQQVGNQAKASGGLMDSKDVVLELRPKRKCAKVTWTR